MISAWLVFCETKEWSDHGMIKRRFNQHQNESTDQPAHQPISQSTNQLTNSLNNQPTVQPTSIETYCSKWVNECIKNQYSFTVALPCNKISYKHSWIKQSTNRQKNYITMLSNSIIRVLIIGKKGSPDLPMTAKHWVPETRLSNSALQFMNSIQQCLYGMFLALDRRDGDLGAILNLAHEYSSSMHTHQEPSFSHTNVSQWHSKNWLDILWTSSDTLITHDGWWSGTVGDLAFGFQCNVI